jgi:hypothetical protein
VNVCECYGRFILHKEATIHKGLEFTEEAEKLLIWTTQRVIPSISATTSLTASNTKYISATPVIDAFDDLNISSIAVEQSFLGVGYSPVATGPRKKRSNFNPTPLKFAIDDSNSLLPTNRTHHERELEAARCVSRAVAVSLLYSSCLLFSEWLALGCAGAQIIGKAALEWGHIFNAIDDSTDLDTQDEVNILLPCFIRLAVCLIISASDSSLLRLLLIRFHDLNRNNDIVQQFKKLTTVLLTSRSSCHDHSPTSIVLSCILDVAHEVSDPSRLRQLSRGEKNDDDDVENEAVSTTFHKLLCGRAVIEGLCPLCAIWEVIVNHRWGCVDLCQLLVEQLDLSVDQHLAKESSAISDTATAPTSTMLLHSKCLSIIVHHVFKGVRLGKKVSNQQKEVLNVVQPKIQSWVKRFASILGSNNVVDSDGSSSSNHVSSNDDTNDVIAASIPEQQHPPTSGSDENDNQNDGINTNDDINKNKEGDSQAILRIFQLIQELLAIKSVT